MWKLFTRRGGRPEFRKSRRILGCESLERRDCPAAPIVQWMSITRLEGNEIRVTGQIADEAPSTNDVRISGAADGIIAVNPDGTFSADMTAASFGQVAARAYDIEGALSPERVIDFQNVAPSVTFRSEQIGNGKFRIFGTVTDEFVSLTTVRISGCVSATARPDASGNFSVEVAPSSPGTFSIDVVDASLRASSTLTGDLHNDPPIIMNFAAQNQNGMWALSGYVMDEFAPGLVVTFHSSISTVNNRTATVGSNGWFSFSFALPPGSYGGFVSATTVDWFGEQSNEPMVYVG